MNLKSTLLLPLLFLAGCLTENMHPVDIYWGTASADFNGESRDFMPFCDTDGIYLNIVLDYYSAPDVLSYHLNLGHIQPQVYRKDTLAAYSTTMANTSEWTNLVSYISNGDQVGNIYKILESEPSHIEVTDWGEINKEIKGNFQATYILDPEWPVNDPTGPDTIRLTNGVFYTRL